MGLLAVQEDGKKLACSGDYAAGGMGQDRRLREAAARTGQRGGAAEGEAGSSDHRQGLCRIAREYSAATLPYEHGISEGAGAEGGFGTVVRFTNKRGTNSGSGDSMNSKLTNLLLLSALALTPLWSYAQKDASLWLTNPDKSALFQLQTSPIVFT